MTVTHKKITQLLKNWGLEQETVTDLYDVGTGNSHENACGIGEAYILKYTANLPELEKTIAVAKALADVGLASAVPVRTLDGREYVQEDNAYFYLTRRLSGQQMVSARFGDGDGRFVGEIIGQLHLALKSIDTPVREADLIATVKNWALPKSKQVMGLSTEFCTEYMNNLESLYPLLPRQIIHRDPNPGNIIRCDDLWGFIDFDLAERNVRIYDPCYAATAVLSETFTGDNGDWLEIYRDIIYGYDSVAHLTEEERKAIPYVLLANQFVCVAWFSEQEQYAEIFETNRNMTRWLMDRMDALRDL